MLGFQPNLCLVGGETVAPLLQYSLRTIRGVHRVEVDNGHTSSLEFTHLVASPFDAERLDVVVRLTFRKLTC